MHKLAATKCIILDQAGQQLAQQMQQSNPELVEQLRSFEYGPTANRSFDVGDFSYA